MLGIGKNIGLDALPILANFSQGTGISKFITNLIKNVLSIDTKNKYYFFLRLFKKLNFDLTNLDEYNQKNVIFKKIFMPDKFQQFCWKNKFCSLYLEKRFYKNIDIYISTTYFTPRFKNIRIISFIYDVSPLRSSVFDTNYRRNFYNLIRETISRSDFFLTISECTKGDVIKKFNLNPQKIEVIYPIIPKIFIPQPTDKIKSVLNKYNIKGRYLLYVRVRGKNKNLMTALKSFFYAVQNYKIPHQLVFVGRPDSSGKVDNELKTFIEENKISNQVVFTGYVPNEELPALYSGAEVFLFPSFYEGFGMPVLEAMSCGVPVVVSNTSSLPEVVGDAGILCNPLDFREFADSIYRIINDYTLRKSLIEKGLVQSKRFSGIKSAEKFISILENI